jgi:hypothetical protein
MGSGDVCGSIFIDIEFYKLISSKLGALWEQLSVESIKEMLHHDWELRIKRIFDPNAASKWTLKVPAEAYRIAGAIGLPKNGKYVFGRYENTASRCSYIVWSH